MQTQGLRTYNYREMQPESFIYAGIVLAIFATPLALSFGRSTSFHKNWKYVFPAIIITAAIFLMWDIKFTDAGIWNFNPDYLLCYGYRGLPVEEWLYFLAIPYACLFVYEAVKRLLPSFEKANLFAGISLGLIVVFAILSYTCRTHLYSFFSFLFLTVYLGYTIFRNRFKAHLTNFYLTFFICLVPLFLIRVFLVNMQVIDFHPNHILGITLFHVPVEDLSNFFLLVLMNTTIYEMLKEGKYY